MSAVLRSTAAALSLSAAALVSLMVHESYTDKAVIPVKGDVPTVGFGSTFREDGTRVQMGDTITPPKAVARSLSHIQKDETRLKTCIKAPVSQAEYDLLVDFAYQYGADVTCRSSMVRDINAGNYAQACRGYTKYKFVTGYDCSTPGNRRCPGVWTRSLERQAKCLAAQ